MNKSSQASVAFVLLLLGFSCAGPAQDPADRLHALFDREWETRLRESPLLATSVGVHRWNDRLPSNTAADRARRREALVAFLAELDTIDRSKLGTADAVWLKNESNIVIGGREHHPVVKLARVEQ